MRKTAAVKKILSIFLALMLLVSMLAGCGSEPAKDSQSDATQSTDPPKETAKTASHTAAENFDGGTGTESDPYQISEPGHLVLLQEKLKTAAAELDLKETYSTAHYILTADIALNDTADFENWSSSAPKYNWEPIGTDATGHAFNGVLDGNGHSISGLYINAVAGNADQAFGLFADMRGTVRNLTIEKAYIQVQGSSANVGVLAGSDRQDGVIENCHVQATVEFYGSGDVGGIIGYASGTTVTNCSFAGSITQMDDGFPNIGGVAGSGGTITGCTNQGTLTGCGYTGGIVGYADIVKDCINNGNVTGDTAGGIAGRLYAAGTGLEIETPDLGVAGCTNEAQVTGTSMAGGILGWMGNDESDISMYVENCENNGQINCDTLAAGIVGKISVERTGTMKVADCVNNVNISGKGTTGGIVGQLTGGVLHQSGNAVISGCKNLGDVISEDLYSGGILAYFLIMADQIDLQLTLEKCTNEGKVEAVDCAGGILGWSNVGFNAGVSAESMDTSEDTSASLIDCQNSGAITTKSSSSFAGGIVGILGLGNIPTQITNCTNSGAVTVDFTLTDEQIAEMQGAEWPEFFQIAGGIVGRIGDGLKLGTAESENRDPANVNSSNPVIRITKCGSTGKITAPDYSFILNKWGTPLYVNYLGGVVGQCSATDGYAFQAESCTYSGAQRGLGDVAFTDIGTKN